VTDAHRTARRTWRRAREFALSLPGAGEEFPWGESVAKVNKKVFAFLGTEETGRRVEDAERALGVTVKLTAPEAHEHALSHPGAEPAGYGLGKAGWVTVPLSGEGAPGAELVCDWIEESYRVIAPKRLLTALDAQRP
jgi:predicted DNA-binding protein (MmcQ/YjbR family)